MVFGVSTRMPWYSGGSCRIRMPAGRGVPFKIHAVDRLRPGVTSTVGASSWKAVTTPSSNDVTTALASRPRIVNSLASSLAAAIAGSPEPLISMFSGMFGNR